MHGGEPAHTERETGVAEAGEGLRESEALHRTILESMGDAVFVTDDRGAFRYVSPSVHTIFGYSRDEVLALGNVDGLIGSGLFDRRAFEASGVLPNLERVVRDKSGRERALLVSIRRVAIHEGTVLYVCREVTDRRRRDDARTARIARLEAENADLEQAAYTVSHDLKSPLITIQGFLGFLKTSIENGNLAEARRDLARVSAAAARMQRLLGELLDLARIGQAPERSEAVSLHVLAHEAVGLVGGAIAARGAAVQVQPNLPVVTGNRSQLVTVLQNLVDNAVKFMGDQSLPRIEIGGKQTSDGVRCYVKDNGLGIEPRFQEKIFGLFERLSADSEGTGAGLAIAKRIVETHGGRIWVESAGEGRGATFWFVLPGSRSPGDA